MPIKHDLITLSETVPTKVAPLDHQPQVVHLHNMTKSSNEYIYLGDADVSTTNSIHIDPGESIRIDLGPSDELFAVSDPDGLELGVLRITQD